MELRSSELGANRTGVQSSPKQAEEMLAASTANASAVGDGSGLAEVRLSYIADADALGSVPPPKTLKGAAKSAIKMTMGKRPQALTDKLAERLAFERSGTRLYEALLVKYEAYSDELANVPLARIQEIRDEEARHFSLVKKAIEDMGGDPTAQTPAADVTGVESMGLMQVLTDPRTTFAQSLHAILVAELTDVDGWGMLIALARAEGQDKMADEFDAAFRAEETHLSSVRQWLLELTNGEAKIIKPS